ncbi:hypothetical protein [Pseudoroseomonas ludipueritiae]|uniref:hypothetical protein n=1 Tax=Pseudoroseomonas ludipueritiae TaxID=198093 RepID=UPI001EEEC374|nr:hypothetical protein [Pseudoroseomonas ludipueritiae]
MVEEPPASATVVPAAPAFLRVMVAAAFPSAMAAVLMMMAAVDLQAGVMGSMAAHAASMMMFHASDIDRDIS